MLRCVSFDFQHKSVELVDPAGGGLESAFAAGRFVWVDLETAPELVRPSLEGDLAGPLGLEAEAIELLSRSRPDTGYEHLPTALHMSMVACTRAPSAEKTVGGRVRSMRVDALLTDRYLLTICRGPAPFMEAIRRDYHEDFMRFAQSQGFLLFELWDHLTRSYESLELGIEQEVERLQNRLAGKPDESVFPLAARVSANLVRLRRHVAPARAVLHELSTRRFTQVPASTQPFLQSTASELDRVLADLTTSREILTDAIALGMSFVSFRTNRVITRLTTVSFIFLPLTFLVGVYGMNFEHQPEYAWRYGYAWFWLLALLTTTAAIAAIVYLWRTERPPT
ncbi:MAG: magnesium transporter CorA family protein [Phycisphaerales bacterium]